MNASGRRRHHQRRSASVRKTTDSKRRRSIDTDTDTVDTNSDSDDQETVKSRRLWAQPVEDTLRRMDKKSRRDKQSVSLYYPVFTSFCESQGLSAPSKSAVRQKAKRLVGARTTGDHRWTPELVDWVSGQYKTYGSWARVATAYAKAAAQHGWPPRTSATIQLGWQRNLTQEATSIEVAENDKDGDVALPSRPRRWSKEEDDQVRQFVDRDRDSLDVAYTEFAVALEQRNPLWVRRTYIAFVNRLELLRRDGFVPSVDQPEKIELKRKASVPSEDPHASEGDCGRGDSDHDDEPDSEEEAVGETAVAMLQDEEQASREAVEAMQRQERATRDAAEAMLMLRTVVYYYV